MIEISNVNDENKNPIILIRCGSLSLINNKMIPPNIGIHIKKLSNGIFCINILKFIKSY
tara:strand:+ start:163 stop:339 length:177 start_codon:yes stop_codon:yes gene_type:complete